MTLTYAEASLAPAALAGPLFRDISIELNRIAHTQPSVLLPPEDLLSKIEGEAESSRIFTPEFNFAISKVLSECKGILYGAGSGRAGLAHIQDMGPKILELLQSTPGQS